MKKNTFFLVAAYTALAALAILFFVRDGKKTAEITALKAEITDIKEKHDKEVAPYMQANREAVLTIVAYGMKMRFDAFEKLHNRRVAYGRLAELQTRIHKMTTDTVAVDSMKLQMLIWEEKELREKLEPKNDENK